MPMKPNAPTEVYCICLSMHMWTGQGGASWGGELSGGGLNIRGVNGRVHFNSGRGAGGRPPVP